MVTLSDLYHQLPSLKHATSLSHCQVDFQHKDPTQIHYQFSLSQTSSILFSLWTPSSKIIQFWYQLLENRAGWTLETFIPMSHEQSHKWTWYHILIQNIKTQIYGFILYLYDVQHFHSYTMWNFSSHLYSTTLLNPTIFGKFHSIQSETH